MKKSLILRFCLFAPVLYLSLTLFSCSSTKKVKYFQDIPDSGQVKTIAKADYKELLIQPGDILNVVIETIDPLSTSTVNAGNVGNTTTPSSGTAGVAGALATLSGANQQLQPITGFQVDKDGNIEIPILGKIKAQGYTTLQLKDIVYKLATKYYKDPTVVVKLVNFKVSVTGEVLKPGQYIMPDEKEGILDALAMAGDLTVYGKRENVLLIRENLDGTKTAYRINLKKSNTMSSPVYYLRQNDIIYVEPRKAKSDATDAAQAKYVGIIAAFFSLLIIIATRVK